MDAYAKKMRGKNRSQLPPVYPVMSSLLKQALEAIS